ncbi:hypothetical protein MD484_g351, partial [Candolleomyces efflorescens]
MEPGATCRACDSCKLGRYELCPDIVFAATPPYDGTLARYYRLPADLAYPLPENVSLEDGAMMEPLSVGVHSVSNLGGLRANQSIAVFGCGPVGLLCMAVAKAIGASRIIAVDIVPARLEFAKTYAATDAYLPPKPLEGESRMDYSRRNAENMKKELGIADRGAQAIDLVIDASGAEVSIQTGLFIAKAGGTFVQVGMGHPNVTIDIGAIITKELQFKGSFRYGPGDYPLAISLVAAGKVDLKPLVTHRFKFDDALVAFKATKAGKSEDGKGVIKAIISGPAPRKKRWKKKQGSGSGREDKSSSDSDDIYVSDSDEDVGMEDEIEEGSEGQENRRDAFGLELDEEEEKPKPLLQLGYHGFGIHGKSICVVVEPWPALPKASKPGTMKELGGLRPPGSSRISIPPQANTTRAETPLFLPDDSELPEGQLPEIQTAGLYTMDDDGDEEDPFNNMMVFSQALRNAGDNRPSAADDDEDMDAAVFFGDADEIL